MPRTFGASPFDPSVLDPTYGTSMVPTSDLMALDPLGNPANGLAQRDAFRRQLILQALADQGRHGDSELAHVNPREASALKAAGGAGTINPRTGLPEFYAIGGGGDYGRASDGSGNLGHAMGGDWGGAGDALGGGVGGAGGRSGDAADRAAAQALGRGSTYTGSGLGVVDVAQGNPNYDKAVTGYENRDWVDRLISGAGGLIGLSDVKPEYSDPSTWSGGTYHTGFNPGEAFGSLGGLAAGGPLGMLAGNLLGGYGYNKLGGKPISFGGGYTPAPGFAGPTPGAGVATPSGQTIAGYTPHAGVFDRVGTGIGNAATSVGNTIGGMFSGGGTSTGGGAYGGGYGAAVPAGANSGYNPGGMPAPAMGGLMQQPAQPTQNRAFQMARSGLALNPAYSP